MISLGKFISPDSQVHSAEIYAKKTGELSLQDADGLYVEYLYECTTSAHKLQRKLCLMHRTFFYHEK